MHGLGFGAAKLYTSCRAAPIRVWVPRIPWPRWGRPYVLSKALSALSITRYLSAKFFGRFLIRIALLFLPCFPTFHCRFPILGASVFVFLPSLLLLRPKSVLPLLYIPPYAVFLSSRILSFRAKDARIVKRMAGKEPPPTRDNR